MEDGKPVLRRVSRDAADQSRGRRDTVSGHRRADAGVDQARLLPVQRQHFTRDYLAHEVTVEEGTRLAGVFGAGGCA
jgi:hypothetical protein